jgi:CubicO group peptidase (beta-lactamase class C family)
VFVNRDGAVWNFAAGRADAADDAPLDASEPLPLYSMTKAITAIAVLELVARRNLDLDALVCDLLPSFPFRAHRVRVGDLLAHTSGLPNPFPLRWVHRPEDHASFDERAARERICRGMRAGAPNVRYRYSNIGYWWLGAVIESLSGKRFLDALADLGLPSTAAYPAGARALGHVRRFGMLRAVGTMALAPWVFAGPAGRWMRIARHHVDGLAYGGLLGTAEGLVPFLCRLLAIARGESGEAIRRALIEPRRLATGSTIPMTAALHVGDGFLFKEGGGAGFHSELRVHVDRGCASAMIANSSEIDVKRLLSEVDAELPG